MIMMIGYNYLVKYFDTYFFVFLIDLLIISTYFYILCYKNYIYLVMVT
jgi:hypothetical protein